MMAGLFKNELTCTIQDGLSNGCSWHIADQRHWRKAMEDRWEEVKILSCKKYAKSITAGNNSILALSEVHQPAAHDLAYDVLRFSFFAYIVPGSAGHSIFGATDVSTRFSNTRYVFHAAVSGLPVVVGGFRVTGLPADIFNGSSGFN